MATSVENASFLIDTLHIDTQQLFKNVKFLVEIEVFATEDPRRLGEVSSALQ